MSDKTFFERVADIQRDLKAPKGQENKFGGYKYRSCEDILEAVKPLLNGLVLTVGDELVLIGDRYYIKATASITDGIEGHTISNVAYAREPVVKKGMDEAQITGATSSYARKYALNGLFLIDDTRDADATNDHKEDKTAKLSEACEKEMDGAATLEQLTEICKRYRGSENYKLLVAKFNDCKTRLGV